MASPLSTTQDASIESTEHDMDGMYSDSFIACDNWLPFYSHLNDPDHLGDIPFIPPFLGNRNIMCFAVFWMDIF
jgi:hypothetical protein